MKIRSKKIVDTNNQSSKCVIIASITSIQIEDDFDRILIHYRVKDTGGSTIITDTFILNRGELDVIWEETKDLIEHGYYKRDYMIKLQLEYFGMFILLISKKFKINIDDLEVIDTDNFIF